MLRVHDRELLDTLASLSGTALQETTWRVSWETRPVLQGGWGAGRWTPGRSFETLYASLAPDGAIAETWYHLSRQPIRSSANKLLYEIKLRTRNTLNLLDSDLLLRLGLGPQPLALTDARRSQEIGAAAHLLEYDSLLVPSARWTCANLVLLLEHFDLDQVEVGAPEPINLAAWREQRAQPFEAFQQTLRLARAAHQPADADPT